MVRQVLQDIINFILKYKFREAGQLESYYSQKFTRAGDVLELGERPWNITG